MSTIIDLTSKNTFLPPFIEYLKRTPPESWCVDVVRTKEGGNCLFGHLFAYGGNDEMGNRLWDFFEAAIACTAMVYPVNDGKNMDYQQPTPKQRCISYLQDILQGKQKTTDQIFEEAMNDR